MSATGSATITTTSLQSVQSNEIVSETSTTQSISALGGVLPPTSSTTVAVQMAKTVSETTESTSGVVGATSAVEISAPSLW
jgi:hypothetical protein